MSCVLIHLINSKQRESTGSFLPPQPPFGNDSMSAWERGDPGSSVLPSREPAARQTPSHDLTTTYKRVWVHACTRWCCCSRLYAAQGVTDHRLSAPPTQSKPLSGQPFPSPVVSTAHHMHISLRRTFENYCWPFHPSMSQRTTYMYFFFRVAFPFESCISPSPPLSPRAFNKKLSPPEMSKLLSHGYAEEDEAKVKTNLQGRWQRVSEILCCARGCAIDSEQTW